MLDSWKVGQLVSWKVGQLVGQLEVEQLEGLEITGRFVSACYKILSLEERNTNYLTLPYSLFFSLSA